MNGSREGPSAGTKPCTGQRLQEANMNDSGARKEISAELFIMANMAWVIPASNGSTSPHRGISAVSLPGPLNARDIFWVVESPASPPPLEAAPCANARTLLGGRMI